MRHLDRSHNAYLLPILDDLCRQANLSPTDLDGIGFACGPGSFTGVRMGAACVQAVATAADCPILAVTTSQGLFLSLADAGPTKQTIAAIKSRGDAYYVALREAYASIAPDEQYLLTEPSDWLLDVCANQDVLLVGSKPPWWPSLDMAPALETSDPGLLVDFVAREIAAGRGRPPHDALPVYFSGDSPWVKTVPKP